MPVVLDRHNVFKNGSEPPEMKLFSSLSADLDFNTLSMLEPQLPGAFPGTADHSAPSRTAAISAIHNIDEILRPPRGTGHGHKHANLNSILRICLEDMLSVLHLFLRHGEWMEDSEEVACTKGQGQCYGRVLCHWIKAFLIDNASLPVTTWGTKMSPALTLNQASRMSFQITSGVLGNTSRHRILLITLTAQRLGGSMVLLFPFH